MTKDQLLARLAELEAERARTAKRAEELKIEIHGLVYDAVTAKPMRASVREIAEAINTDRSWIYILRDEYPEKLRKWRESHPPA